MAATRGAGFLNPLFRSNFPSFGPHRITSQSLKTSSIHDFPRNPCRGIHFLAPKLADVQNLGHETSELSPENPKLQRSCVSDGSIHEGTSFFRVKKLSDKAILPSRAFDLSAGYDLSSAADTAVPARGKAMIPTDLSIAIPQGTYARVAPRSGLTWKHSIDVGAGVIDADYRGPLAVILFNHSDVDFEVKMGDRIAQLIIHKIMTPEVCEVNDLDSSLRGTGGFGSTGT